MCLGFRAAAQQEELGKCVDASLSAFLKGFHVAQYDK